ncbi:39S ribosomal protein L44 [Mactra antiquata]
MAALQCVRSLSKVRYNVLHKFSAAVMVVENKSVRRYSTSHQLVGKSSNSRQHLSYLYELYHRRIEVGPEKERHPSEYGCWNHDAEIYAFGQRFGEDFNDMVLKEAFVQRCFVEQEIEKQKDLGLDMEIDMTDNEILAEKGYSLASRFIKAYLRYSFPQLFEEGISAIHDFLLSDEMLFHIGCNIGLKELIQSATYPPEHPTYVTTLKAVIGALIESQNEKKAEDFVLDLIIPQLVGIDVSELWNIENPMGLLCALLKEQNLGEPEARLLWSSASNTIMPLHHVGIYSDKKLLGKSPGETISIAEDMAAREAIKKLLNMTDNRSPLELGDKAKNLELDFNKTNRSVSELNCS